MTVQVLEYPSVAEVVRPVSRPNLRVVADGEVIERRRMRPSQARRLACTLLVFGLLSLAVLTAWARSATPDLPATHEVVVRPGQTLSQIASEELPTVPLETAMLRIRMANGLSSAAVMSGQQLIVPGEGWGEN